MYYLSGFVKQQLMIKNLSLGGHYGQFYKITCFQYYILKFSNEVLLTS